MTGMLFIGTYNAPTRSSTKTSCSLSTIRAMFLINQRMTIPRLSRAQKRQRPTPKDEPLASVSL